MTPTVARWTVTAIAAVAGLVVGSFLNVVVYRTPRRLSVVRPPSFCPSCHAPVRAFDNVPVLSWVVLRGRCRSCRAPISPRYPLVEAGTAVLFALVALSVGPHPAVAGLCVLSAALAAGLVVDLDGQRLPPLVPATGAGLGTAGLVAAAAADHHWAHLAGAVVGTVAVVAALGLAHSLAVSPTGSEAGPRVSWALVPAGSVVGWSEPLGAAIGGAVLVLGFVVTWRPSWSRDAGRTAAARVLGAAALAFVSAFVAVLTAVVAGSGLF